jgi:hypothetical protein
VQAADRPDVRITGPLPHPRLKRECASKGGTMTRVTNKEPWPVDSAHEKAQARADASR